MKIILLVGCVMILCVSHVHAQCSADAGQDFYICGNMALLTGTVSGNTGAVVTWSCPVAGVTFSNPGAAVTNVVFSSQVPQGTSIPLVLTEYITVPSCIATDTVLVIIYQPQYPLPLVDPADSINCGRVTTHLAAQQPAYGVGYWYDSAALTQFYPDNYSNNPDSVVITSSAYGTHHFYWVTVNGICCDTSEVVSITFYEQPVANAGGNYWSGLLGADSEIKTDTTNGLSYILNAVPSIGIGQWFSLDVSNIYGTGLVTTNPDTVYFYNFTYTNHEIFVWVEDNHSCTDKDTLFLYVLPGNNVNETILENRIFIYPNPITTSATLIIPNFEIRNPKSDTGNSSDLVLRISDLTGKVVRTQSINELNNLQIKSSSNRQIEFNRSDLKPGLYYLEVTAGKVYRAKLLVE